MEQPIDEAELLLRHKLQESEDKHGASIETVYAMEELAQFLEEKKKLLPAADLKARIRLMRKKLGLVVQETAWSPIPGKVEGWFTAILLLVAALVLLWGMSLNLEF